MADYIIPNNIDNAMTEHKKAIFISVDTDIYDKFSEVCNQCGFTPDEAILSFLHYCSKHENKNVIIQWYANYIADEEKRTGSLNFSILPHFKSEQLQNDFESICEEARMGCSPVIIQHDDKEYLLFNWNDYMNRFGTLYTKEQISLINEACKNFKEN